MTPLRHASAARHSWGRQIAAHRLIDAMVGPRRSASGRVGEGSAASSQWSFPAFYWAIAVSKTVSPGP